jgi:DNA invertase Pin-like site-specific DNA recombinase
MPKLSPMGKRAGDPKVVVLYVRASTSEQRLGPEAQRSALAAFVAREGLSVAACHEDLGVSGSTTIEERPGLLAALSALREHNAGVLLVVKLDRVARDVVIAATVERAVAKMGARLVSVAGEGNGDSPADTFMRNVVSAAAQYERGILRARTVAALSVKRSRGERISRHAPYGWRVADDGVRLERVEEEQAVLAQVGELAAAGMSQRAIARELTSRGLLSRVGTPFAKTQIARMLA